MSAASAPAAACSLSLSDCDIVLQNSLKNDARVHKAAAFKVAPISDHIAGYLGKHLKLEIKHRNQQSGEMSESRFFLKSTTDVDNPYGHFYPQVHFKESGMYAIMAKYNLECGHLFGLDVAAELYLNHAQSETMVMEDLSLRGFRLHDPVDKTVDAAHMRVALEALAQLHASSVIYEEARAAKLGRRFELTEEFGRYLEEVAFSRQHEGPYRYSVAGLRAMCALTDLLEPDSRISPSELKRQIVAAGDRMFDLMADTRTYRCAWSHGDLWARNLMYSYDEDGRPTVCKLVDFQFARYAPPALDVTILIYHTSSREMFERNYGAFLDHYFDCFAQNLQRANVNGHGIYTKESFLKSCEDYLLCAKMMLGIYRTLTAATEENYWQLAGDLAAFEHALMVDRSEFAKKNFLGDEKYEKQLTDIMEVVKNMILEDTFTRAA